MAIHEDVLVRLDERSVRSVASDLESRFSEAATRSGTVLTKELGGAFDKIGQSQKDVAASFEKTTSAVRNATSSLSEAANSVGGLSQAFQGLFSGALDGAGFSRAAAGASSLTDALGSAGLAGAAGLGGVAVAAGAAVKGLYDLGSQWHDISNSIIGQTGKVGDQLSAMTTSVANVADVTAASLTDIANVAAQVDTSLHLSGSGLEAMTKQITDLNSLRGGSLDVRDLGKAYRLFDVSEVGNQTKALDELNNVSQKAAIPLNELISTLVKVGSPAKDFGLSMGETAGLITQFEQAGMETTKILPGLSHALRTLAATGREPGPALADTVTQIKALIDAGNDPGAITLAEKVFGGRDGADFVNLIRGGNLDIKTLTASMQALGDDNSIEKQKEATEDWHGEWEKLTNYIGDVFKPVAEGVFGGINDAIKASIDSLKGWGHILDSRTWMPVVPITGPSGPMPPGYNPANPLNALSGAPAGQSQPGAPGNPMDVFAPTAPGSIPGGTGNTPTAAPGLPGPNLSANPWGTVGNGFYDDWYPKNQKGGAGGSSAKTPGAPAVPFDSSLPPGFANLPQTASLFSAESSYMDANTKVAEKRARVAQLEGDTNAKADEVLNAHNDLITAERTAHEAELRLYDTQNKALKNQVVNLGEIGAKLDKDFGISKGLSGIAENLTKFIANLAAAPLLGQLGAVAATSPSQGGFGLIGALGAQGAFGPQFTGLPQAGQGKAQATLGTDGQVSLSAPSAAAMGTAAGTAIASAGHPGAAGTSPNGFPLYAAEQGFAVNGVSTQAAAGGPAQQLQQFAQWFNDTIEPVKEFAGYDRGGHGLGTRSNHASGTALDINWDDFTALQGNGADARTHFSPAQMQAISQKLSQSGMTWGQYWTPDSRDPGHFELAGAPYSRNGPQNVAPISGGSGVNHQTYDGGGVLPPGITIATNNTGKPESIHTAEGKGPGIGNAGGLGSGAAPGGVGASAGEATQIGGLAAPQGTGKGGIGLSSGLAGGLDALGAIPGIGQAAAAGGKLANRAIQFGSQAVGIGVQGLMETFLPTGGSKLAQNNWATKIIGGIAGAGLALPNTAGPKSGQPTAEGVVAQGSSAVPQGGGGSPPGNTFNVTVNNSRATEDGTGRDLTHHLEAAYSPPGMS